MPKNIHVSQIIEKNTTATPLERISELIETELPNTVFTKQDLLNAITAQQVIDFFVTSMGTTEKKAYDYDYFDDLVPNKRLFNELRDLLSSGRITLETPNIEELTLNVVKNPQLIELVKLLFPNIFGLKDFQVFEEEWEAAPEPTRREKRKVETVSKAIQAPEIVDRFDFIPATENHVSVIPDLLDAVYKGDYPYEQFYDQKWLKKQIQNEYVYFRIFWDKVDKKVIGFTYQYINPITRGLYMGSTVIHPKYQSANVLTTAAMNSRMNWLREVISLLKPTFLWGEIRACDVRMQKYLERLGFKPVALLLDYDTGMGQRESEVIMMKVLERQQMDEEVKILPEIEPFARMALRQLRVKRKFVFLDIKPEAVNDIFSFPTSFEFNTHFYPDWDGELELRFNPKTMLRIMTSQKYGKLLISATMGESRVRVEYDEKIGTARIFAQGLEERPTGIVLLNWLDVWLRFHRILYADVFVSAVEPFAQAWFKQHDWNVVGYFPGFYPNVVANTPEDAVLFRLKTPIRTRKLTFTPLTYKLAKKILPRQEFDVEWNEKYSFMTLRHNEDEVDEKPLARADTSA